MGLANFVAIDGFRPRATETELNDLISRMDGVIDWRIKPDGDVIVEYNHDLISDQVIESALRGIGFSLTHISDDPEADPADALTALKS